MSAATSAEQLEGLAIAGLYGAQHIAAPGTKRGSGFGQKTLALIEASIATLEEIQPASVRAVAYQLFNRKLIASMGKNETDKVSRALTMAREDGRIPWSWIVDETREIKGFNVWRNPAEYADAVMSSYSRDWWAEQPERVRVVSEKATVRGMLRPVLREYRAEFLVLHGFGSATTTHMLAELSTADTRPLVLLYMGDHDPSGRHMSDVDIPARLRRYGGEAELVRLAVTPEQITTPEFFFSAHTKSRDARYDWFMEAHGETGEQCCELDALDPNVLRDLVEGAITERIDWGRWHEARADERRRAGSDPPEHADVEGNAMALSILRRDGKYSGGAS